MSASKDRFHLSDSYALGYLLLSECSAEPATIAQVIQKHWHAPNETPRPLRGLLDVGAADGRINRLIAAGFDRVSLYEPNEILYALCLSRLPRDGRHEAHNRAWDYRETVPGFISHVLLSHVLYHIPVSRWMGFLRNLLLRPDQPGRHVTISLWNPDGEAHLFCRDVNPDRWHVTSRDLLEVVEKLGDKHPGIQVQADSIEPTIVAPTLAAAESITTFLLGRRHPDDKAGQAQKETLRRILMGSGLNNSQTFLTLTA